MVPYKTRLDVDSDIIGTGLFVYHQRYRIVFRENYMMNRKGLRLSQLGLQCEVAIMMKVDVFSRDTMDADAGFYPRLLGSQRIMLQMKANKMQGIIMRVRLVR